MIPRTRPRCSEGTRHHTTHCEAPRCHASTREGKPYCPEHVELNPYIRELMAQLASREREEANVGKLGARAVDLEGITAQEILQHLRVHGSRTLKRLARELNISLKVLQGYTRALERRKLIALTQTDRGGKILHLYGQEPDPATVQEAEQEAA